MVDDYELPYSEHVMQYTDGQCRRCIQLGRRNKNEYPIQPGMHLHLDAKGFYICDDCYRDMQREGKVW